MVCGVTGDTPKINDKALNNVGDARDLVTFKILFIWPQFGPCLNARRHININSHALIISWLLTI